MAESMQGLKRTHRCAELSSANVGEKVTIMGWVQKNRNKGGLVFVDVRDRSGLIQVVFEEGKSDAALIEKAAKLRSEFVVAIVGEVAKRSALLLLSEREPLMTSNSARFLRISPIGSSLVVGKRDVNDLSRSP